MERSKRRRSDRHNPARGRPGASLEALERRDVMAPIPTGYNYYLPEVFPPRTVDHVPPAINPVSPAGNASDRLLSYLDNEGKILTGKDRQGDEWTITVHGPGDVIVTDTSPNDGVFDDDLDTIQIVGSSPTSTYVTGEVVASGKSVIPAKVVQGQPISDISGTVLFNRLIAENGVKSIILNGFTLARTTPTPAGTAINAGPEIYLPGGVQELQFHDIEAQFTPNVTENVAEPIDIIIGNPTTPLKVKPSIRLDTIFNTVFTGVAQSVADATPIVLPTVNVVVNGELHGLDFIASTSDPRVINQTLQNLYPPVSITGRTSVQAIGIDHLSVAGSAKNFTAARSAVPYGQVTSSGVLFPGPFSGLNHIGSANFGGTADGVVLDVNGPINRLQFARGLGNPASTRPAATYFGTPAYQTGYPSAGLEGGVVTAQRIGALSVGPADLIRQTANNPNYIQLRRSGTTYYYTSPGNALTTAAITSDTTIGQTHIVGTAQQSEIKAGFNYASFLAGLEGTRAPSRIRPLHQRGDIVDSAVSSTYRTTDLVYGNNNDLAGPGLIAGQFNGVLTNAGASTPLNNRSAGYFARIKVGNLPPPSPTRVHSVLIR